MRQRRFRRYLAEQREWRSQAQAALTMVHVKLGCPWYPLSNFDDNWERSRELCRNDDFEVEGVLATQVAMDCRE